MAMVAGRSVWPRKEEGTEICLGAEAFGDADGPLATDGSAGSYRDCEMTSPAGTAE